MRPFHLTRAFELLWEGHCLAADSGECRWQFAVNASELFRSGLSMNGIRWLTSNKLVEFRQETTSSISHNRQFQCDASLRRISDSCLILSKIGIRFLKREYPDIVRRISLGECASPLSVPEWIPGKRELCLGNQVVKRFRATATNQELVLMVFQEDGWSERIEDPLPRSRGIDPKQRLHDTIKNLNRRHATPTPRLRFAGDGTGQGVCWQLVCDQP